MTLRRQVSLTVGWDVRYAPMGFDGLERLGQSGGSTKAWWRQGEGVVSPLTRLPCMASPPNEIYAYVSPRGGAESVRTFRCRGGLANDGSSTSWEFILLCRLPRLRRSEKSSRSCSPVLAPVSPVRCVCRQGYVQPHAPTFAVAFLALTIATLESARAQRR